VDLHGAAGLDPVLDRVPQGLRAVGEHPRESATVSLRGPLFLGQGPGEFGSVLEDEDEPAVVDVREELADRRAARRRPEIPHGLREGPKQVDEDGVVPVPGVQQSFEQASIRCFHIFRSMLRRLD